MMETLVRICSLFAERKCPQQRQVEKLFLFPQISTIEEIEKICSSKCYTNEVICSERAEKVLTSIQQFER